MRKFTVNVSRHKGKILEVTKYIKTASGVEIELKHNVPKETGKELRWVQTVTENGSFYRDCKRRPYVDPYGKGGSLHTVALPGVPGVCKADDAKPFYYTDAEIAGGSGPGLYDKPGESAPKKGRTWIQFVTALTEVTNKNVHHLVAIAWGFDRLASGLVKVAAIHTPTTDQMRKHGRALKSMYPSYRFT